MPVFNIETNTGHRLKIEADTPEAALEAGNSWKPSVGEDVMRSVASAPRKVAEGFVGLPGTIEQGIKAGANWIQGTTPEKPIQHFATPDIIQGVTSKVLGPSYQAQTPPGQYAGAATEGALGALTGPGGLMAKLGMGIASGLGSEFAKHQTKGTPYEIPATIAGGVVGGLGASGANKTIEGVRNFLSAASAGEQIGNILGTGRVKAGAVSRVAKSAEQDSLTLPTALDTQARLGPNETMIMDLGRQLQGRAEQMALHSGKAQNTVLDAVEGRTGQFGSGASERFRQTLDTELGPSQNVVHLLDRVDDLVQKQARPAYEAVMARYPKIGVIEDITERPAVRDAMGRAKSIAANYGDKLPDTPSQGLHYWDYVKKALDHRINGMMRSGMDDLSSVEKADLGGLISAKQALVKHLDDITQGEYARARSIAATKPELHDAMDFGRSIFSSKLLPEEVRAHIGDLSIPGQTMAQVGARRELERVLDSVRNDGAKARAFLDTNNNRQKISDLFGPQAAQAIENRVAAENTFQNATDTIARNSRTAVRQELAKDTATPQAGDYHTTLTGLTTAPIKSGLAYALEHGMTNTRSGISDILTAKRDQLPLVVEQLLKHNQNRASNAGTPAGMQMQALLRALMTEQVGR